VWVIASSRSASFKSIPARNVPGMASSPNRVEEAGADEAERLRDAT
jgi:hypothetical protein